MGLSKSITLIVAYIYELHRYTFFTPQLILDTGHYFNNLISGFYGVIAFLIQELV